MSTKTNFFQCINVHQLCPNKSRRSTLITDSGKIGTIFLLCSKMVAMWGARIIFLRSRHHQRKMKHMHMSANVVMIQLHFHPMCEHLLILLDHVPWCNAIFYENSDSTFNEAHWYFPLLLPSKNIQICNIS